MQSTQVVILNMGEAVEQLANQVQVLRESVDELKTVLEHAIRNGRIVIEFSDASSDARLPSSVEMQNDQHRSSPSNSRAEANSSNDANVVSPPPRPRDLF